MDFNDYLLVALGVNKAVAPPTFFLSHEVRKKMHELGWTEVHQTDINKGRECPYQLYLSLLQRNGTGREKRVMSPHALLGTVFHKAFEEYDMCCQMGMDPWFWRQLFLQTLARDEETTNYVLNDNVITETSPLIDQWSLAMSNSKAFGISPANIIRRLMEPIKQGGWEIVGQEYQLEYIDGDGTQYPIRFVGTIDMVVMIAAMLYIVDLKTYGFWDPIIKGEGSVKSQSHEEQAIQLDPQMRHYDALYWLITGLSTDGYGLIFPSNAVPYLKSGKNYKAGDERGQKFALVPSLGPHFRKNYIEDLMGQISCWVNGGFHRSYPRMFGKLYCPSCPHYQSCLGSSKAFVTSEQRAFAQAYRK